MPTQQDYYTWKQFREKVLELLPVDSRRKGVGTAADTYLTQLIRQAVINLQSCIDELRSNHEVIYELSDMVQEGCALKGVKPPQSAIRDIYWLKFNPTTERCTRYPVSLWDWRERGALINKRAAVNGGVGLFAIDPQGYEFYAYPVPRNDECWKLSIFYDGLKLEFRDEEQIPFDEAVVGAVAFFVKAMISREANNDITMYNSNMADFNRQKPIIMVREKEKRDVKSIGTGGTPRCDCITLSPTGTGGEEEPTALVAAFTYTPHFGNVPLPVQFTDASTGTPASWLWDFGDGTTSTEQNPSHEYATSGNYSVMLTVTNSDGSDSVSHPVLVITEIDAEFTMDVSSGDARLTVQFTDTSTGSPTSWEWNFGDGSAVSTTQNPSHIFTEPGTYSVQLIARNATSQDSVTHQVVASDPYILNPPQPPDVGTLNTWLKADADVYTDGAGTIAAANTNRAKLWKDQSSGGWDVDNTAVNASRPQYFTNIQNSLPALWFENPTDDPNPGAQSYDVLYNGNFNFPQPQVLIWAMQFSPVNNGSTVRIFGHEAGGSDLVVERTDTSTLRARGVVSGLSIEGGSLTDTDFHILTLVVNGADSILRVNGVQVATGNLGTSNLITFIIGGWTGYMCEVVRNETELSEFEIVGLENYLAQKWDITI